MQPLGSSYRKGLVLSLGSVIQTHVDLYSVVPASKGTGLHRMCPEHKVQLKQTHKCPEGHELAYGEWVMGSITGDVTVLAPTTAKPVTMKDDTFELTPIPAAELDDNTFDGASLYYAKPSDPTTQAWLALKTIVDEGEIALVTKGALKQGSEKMYRLTTFRNYLVLREIVFPEAIRQIPDPPEEHLDPEAFALISKFLENLTGSWDDLDTVDRSREELIAWIENGETIANAAPVPPDAAQNLIEQLKAAVKNNK